MLRYVCIAMCLFGLVAVPASAQTMSVGTGPYTPAIVEGDSGVPNHTIYRPKDLEPFSKKNPMPVLAWGNGGCSSSSSMHANFLAEVASQGFLVLALGPYREPGAERGAGMMGGGGGTTSAQMLEAIDWATKENKNKDSKYYEKLNPSLFAVAGMSCGGIQALEVSPDPRVKTTMVMDSGLFGASRGAPGAPGAAAPGAPEHPEHLEQQRRSARSTRSRSTRRWGARRRWRDDGNAQPPEGAPPKIARACYIYRRRSVGYCLSEWARRLRKD